MTATLIQFPNLSTIVQKTEVRMDRISSQHQSAVLQWLQLRRDDPDGSISNLLGSSRLMNNKCLLVSSTAVGDPQVVFAGTKVNSCHMETLQSIISSSDSDCPTAYEYRTVNGEVFTAMSMPYGKRPRFFIVMFG